MKTITTISILACIMLSGCNQPPFPKPDDPGFAPIIPDQKNMEASSKGSLYVAGGGLSLYQDIKAYHPGDILTVKLVERTTATKDAKTSLKRDYENNSQTNAGANILGNVPKFKLGQLVPFLRSKSNTLSTQIDADSTFKGQADSNQKNSLTGDISVTVAQILPNKNLVIRGEKWLNLNQGSEYIRLTGIVRPNDISSSNEVLSTKIADARISYSGTGALSDTNRAGWLVRFFNSIVWPF